MQSPVVPLIALIGLDDRSWHTHVGALDELEPAVMAEVNDLVLAWVPAQCAP